MSEFWVFGYGSLMWRPGFAYRRHTPALLSGYHRSLCVLSHVHRGTPERPGLVLGLDRGGACRGVAFEIAPADVEHTLAYLRERELVTHVYREVLLPVRLLDEHPRRVSALAYVVDRTHPQYAGRQSLDGIVERVRHGVGRSGANPDYVRATHDHLLAMGLTDGTLAAVVERLAGPGSAGTGVADR